MLSRGALLAAAVTAVASLQAVPTLAAPTSTVGIAGATVSGPNIAVSGTISFGDDLLAAKTVGTDPAGDVPGQTGLDLTSLSISTNLTTKTFTFVLGVGGALMTAPGTGYQVAFMVDGDDRTLWLGGGSAGTGFPPTTGSWVGVCNNQAGGYSCVDRRTGGVTLDKVTWNVPFAVPNGPLAAPGSMLEPGSILCGASPCSQPWVVLAPSAAPTDRMDPWSAYKIPGEVLLGIAASGTPESAVEYASSGTLNTSNGTYTGTVPTPITPGTYTVFVKTCGGIADALTCAVGTRDITV